MGSSEYGAMLSVANVTTGSLGTVNEANKSVDTRRPSRCSDLQGSRAPLNPYQLSLLTATLLQIVLSSDINESPRQKTRLDGNGLLRRERRWRGRLVRTSHYFFRQRLTKHSLAAVLCHTTKGHRLHRRAEGPSVSFIYHQTKWATSAGNSQRIPLLGKAVLWALRSRLPKESLLPFRHDQLDRERAKVEQSAERNAHQTTHEQQQLARQRCVDPHIHLHLPWLPERGSDFETYNGRMLM